MKCYIATYYKYNNYGTRLQNYALLYTLKNMGFDVETIYLNDSADNFKKFIKKVLSIFPVTNKQKMWFIDNKKGTVFKNFNNKLNYMYIDSMSLKELNGNNAIAIAGSDQIWSPLHLNNNKKDIDLFFLNFMDNSKRYTYAPSFGVEDIPLSMDNFYKENLKNFKMLSIREESGQKILNKLLNNKVDILPDPVFLLDKDEWDNNSKKSNNYILTYFLGNNIDKRIKNIEEFAKNKNLKVINIAGNEYINNCIIPNPDEFVQLIHNADVVFTDSFHASAFSIIFNTPFYVYQRDDVKQFSRIDSLLKDFNLENRVISDNIDLDDLNDEFYVDANKILEKKRLGLDYLKKIEKDYESNER